MPRNSFLQQYLKYMFTIKVAFKGKNVLLGKGINSLEAIHEELAARFPGEVAKGVCFQYKGEDLNNFEQIRQIVDSNSLKSIKIQAIPMASKIQSQQSSRLRSQSPELLSQKQYQHIKEEQEEKNGFSAQTEEIYLSDALEKSAGPIEIAIDIKKKVAPINEENLKESDAEAQAIEKEQKEKAERQRQDEQRKKQEEEEKETARKEQERKKQEERERKEKEEQIKKLLQEKAVVIQKNWRRFAVQTQMKQLAKRKQRFIQNKSDTESEYQLEEQKSADISNKSSKVSSATKKTVEICQKRQDFQFKSDKLEKEIPQIVNQKKQEEEFDEEDVYKCFYCLGKKECTICSNTGHFGENSPFIRLIDRLIDARLEKRFGDKFSKQLRQQKMSEIKLEGHIKIEEKSEPSEIKSEKINFKELLQFDKQTFHRTYIIDGFNKRKEAQQNKQFYWNFQIGAPSDLKSNVQVNVMDDRTGESMIIKFAPDYEFSVGPFVPKRQSKLQHTYRLFYFDERSQMQFFGPRFGFSVPVVNLEKKTLLNNLRIQISQNLKKHKVPKTVEYVLENLKAIGINEENYHQSKDLVQEVILGLI